MSNLIRKHEWHYDVTRTFEHCAICKQWIGDGQWEVYPCHERFDTEKFKRWLEFKNYSKIKSKSKITRYIKRFTNQIFTEKRLLKDFSKMLITFFK